MSKSTSDLFRKAILVAIGATAVTVEKVNSVIDELVEKGEMSEQQAKSFKDEVKEKAMAEKETFEKKMQDVMQNTISKVMKDMGLVVRKDLEDLEKRLVNKIEGKSNTQENQSGNCCCNCE